MIYLLEIMHKSETDFRLLRTRFVCEINWKFCRQYKFIYGTVISSSEMGVDRLVIYPGQEVKLRFYNAVCSFGLRVESDKQINCSLLDNNWIFSSTDRTDICLDFCIPCKYKQISYTLICSLLSSISSKDFSPDNLNALCSQLSSLPSSLPTAAWLL